MKKIRYDVIYHYYQYNSGAGDNGYGTGVLHYSSLEQAQKMYKKINSSIQKRIFEEQKYKNNDNSEAVFSDLSEDEDYDLMCDLLPYSGYFVKAQLAKTMIEKVLLNEQGQEII